MLQIGGKICAGGIGAYFPFVVDPSCCAVCWCRFRDVNLEIVKMMSMKLNVSN